MIPGREGALRKRINVRRRHISAILLRDPTLTMTEVAIKLEDAGIVNADTGKRYSHSTITGDLDLIVKDWQKRSSDDVGKMKGRQLAEIDEMRKAAWGRGDLEFVLKLMQHESKLLGLDSPLMIEHFASFDMTKWQQMRDQRLADAEIIVDDVEQPKLRPTEDGPRRAMAHGALDDRQALTKIHGRSTGKSGVPEELVDEAAKLVIDASFVDVDVDDDGV